jgi:pimeloyl-ACP methyl ester carboxylesterase
MSTLRDDDSKVWFYAFDYGSFLLNKAILLNSTIAEPVKIDKIVLEGVLPPDIGELVMAERNAQTAAGQLLQLCSLTDSTCEHYLHMSSSSLLDSQWRVMQLNASQCSSLFSIESVKLALSRLLSHPTHRIALPSIFKRFSRCEASDITELQFWMALESKRNAPRLAPAIAYNILFSELFSHSRPPVGPETLRMLRDMSPLTAFPDFCFFEGFESWPTYQPTPYMSRIFGDYSGIDVLIMHGELDPIAPWAWALHTSNRLKTAKSSELVLVPNGLHMPSISSGDCVSRSIVNWLLERTTNAKSKACWEALEDLDFSSTKSTSTTSQLLFGEPQLWGQGATVIVTPAEAQPAKDPHRRFTWHTWVLAVTWLVLVVFVLASFIVLVARGGGATHRPTGLLLAEEESRRSAGYLPVSTLDD